MNDVEIKRREWLKNLSTSALCWDDLSEKEGWNGQNLQVFWRLTGSATSYLSDDELVEKGYLKLASDGRLYHLAYIPWVFHDANIQKESWSDDQWNLLRNAIAEVIQRQSSAVRSISWEKLTLPSDVAETFVQSKFNNSHIIGNIGVLGIHTGRFRFNLIDGNLEAQTKKISDLIINGRYRSHNQPLELTNCVVKELSYRPSDEANQALELRDSFVDTLTIFNHLSHFSSTNSSFGQILCEGVSLGKFSVIGNGHSVAFKLTDSTFAGRFFLSGMDIKDEYDDSRRSLEHSKFQEKVRIINCNMPISILADVQLEAPIDIEFDTANPEDIFEDELQYIRDNCSDRPSFVEMKRRRLERACQLICDRHRQDGRKDMEHRFRRMELKARAYRDGADFGTKFLTWAYDFFSDFGRSFLRPLRGLALLWGTFFIVYWLLGVIALAPPVDLGSKIESKLIIDAALLSADKLFPFGTSVDESALFSAKLLGADAGIMGVVAGVLGPVDKLIGPEAGGGDMYEAEIAC